MKSTQNKFYHNKVKNTLSYMYFVENRHEETDICKKKASLLNEPHIDKEIQLTKNKKNIVRDIMNQIKKR